MYHSTLQFYVSIQLIFECQISSVFGKSWPLFRILSKHFLTNYTYKKLSKWLFDSHLLQFCPFIYIHSVLTKLLLQTMHAFWTFLLKVNSEILPKFWWMIQKMYAKLREDSFEGGREEIDAFLTFETFGPTVEILLFFKLIIKICFKITFWFHFSYFSWTPLKIWFFKFKFLKSRRKLRT